MSDALSFAFFRINKLKALILATLITSNLNQIENFHFQVYLSNDKKIHL